MENRLKTLFLVKNIVSISRRLQLLHLNIWVMFPNHKDASFYIFKFCKCVQNDKGLCNTWTRSDHGGEFENNKFQLFYEENGIVHNFSTPRTPQQNGVVERKNRSLQEMVRTMLNDNSTPNF